MRTVLFPDAADPAADTATAAAARSAASRETCSSARLTCAWKVRPVGSYSGIIVFAPSLGLGGLGHHAREGLDTSDDLLVIGQATRGRLELAGEGVHALAQLAVLRLHFFSKKLHLSAEAPHAFLLLLH